MHSDAASQGGGWWQGCGAAYRQPHAKIAEAITHWKNMPSPVSYRLTGTKFEPKKRTAIATAR